MSIAFDCFLIRSCSRNNHFSGYDARRDGARQCQSSDFSPPLSSLAHFLIDGINFFFTAFDSTGYETRIGYVDVKTSSGVYFYVGRSSNYEYTP